MRLYPDSYTNEDRCPGARPFLVADCGFGSTACLSEIKNMGGSALLAMPISSIPSVWSVLQFHLPADHWRAAVHMEESYTASTHRIVDKTGKFVTQQLISNASACHIIDYAHALAAGSLASSQIPTQTPSTSDLSISPADTAPAADPSAAQIPFYTREKLEDMTVPQLRDICAQYNILRGNLS